MCYSMGILSRCAGEMIGLPMIGVTSLCRQTLQEAHLQGSLMQHSGANTQLVLWALEVSAPPNETLLVFSSKWYIKKLMWLADCVRVLSFTEIFSIHY